MKYNLHELQTVWPLTILAITTIMHEQGGGTAIYGLGMVFKHFTLG